MELTQIVVSLAGLALSAFVAWFFWFSPREATRAAVTGGMQELDILVKGGYTPDLIVVQAGKPVRLNFTRRDSSACSEMVLFDDLGKSAFLPEGRTIALEILPEQRGEFEFHCQMNMLRGKLIVE